MSEDLIADLMMFGLLWAVASAAMLYAYGPREWIPSLRHAILYSIGLLIVGIALVGLKYVEGDYSNKQHQTDDADSN
jgi:hypothetical protein